MPQLTVYYFEPDGSSFEPTQVEGLPFLTNEVTGPESWSLGDLTTGQVPDPDVFKGADAHTTLGSFNNDDFISSNTIIFGHVEVASYTQFDLADFGNGFENELIDIPTGTEAGMSDLLITPMGNFELFGTFFSDLAAV